MDDVVVEKGVTRKNFIFLDFKILNSFGGLDVTFSEIKKLLNSEIICPYIDLKESTNGSFSIYKIHNNSLT